MNEDLIYRLKKRAEVRRQITTRKNVQEGKSDRLSNLLEEAAIALEEITKQLREAKPIGDGSALEMRRGLVAPLEFNSLAYRQDL